jgi:hypothetical protein
MNPRFVRSDAALMLAKEARDLARQDPTHARRLYLVAGRRILACSRRGESLLWAALCFEKAQRLQRAADLYRSFSTRVSGPQCRALAGALHARCQAKAAEAATRHSEAAYYYKKSAELFREASSESTDTWWRGQWSVAGDEMHRRARTTAQTVLRAIKLREAPDKAPHGWRVRQEVEVTRHRHTIIFDNCSNAAETPTVLVTGAMHGNEIAGTPAIYELMNGRGIRAHVLAWPCIDVIGFCHKEEDSQLGHPASQILPPGMALCQMIPEADAVLAEAAADAGPFWLDEIMPWIRKLSVSGRIRFFIWRQRRWYGPGPAPCRAFTITDDQLVPVCGPGANNGIEEALAKLEHIHGLRLWIDLHESRGDGFHIYVAHEAPQSILRLCRRLIVEVANDVRINRRVLLRQPVACGVYRLPAPAPSRLWRLRVVLECGQSVPAWRRVDVLRRAAEKLISWAGDARCAP